MASALRNAADALWADVRYVAGNAAADAKSQVAIVHSLATWLEKAGEGR